MPEHPANWLARVREGAGAPSGRVMDTNAWGDDDLPADEQPSISGRSTRDFECEEDQRGGAKPQGRPMPAGSHTAAQRSLASLIPAPRTEPGPPSLQSMCLGCLGMYLSELVEIGGEVAASLTADQKASLLALARRTEALDDAALEVLVDEDWTILDVGQVQITSTVSDKCLQKVLQRLPRLLHLDITRVPVSAKTLRSLSTWCPKLQTLRLGGNGSADTAAAAALPSLVPCISGQESSSADSWEDVGELKSQRLVHLSHLEWPLAPKAAVDVLLRLCPRLAINPGPSQLRGDPLRGRKPLPVEANADVPLDAAAAAAVGQFDWGYWCQILPDAGSEPDVVPNSRSLAPGELSVADRFKLAYEQRAQRVALKVERNRRQAWRRHLRENPSLQLIMMAEGGVPLHRARR